MWYLFLIYTKNLNIWLLYFGWIKVIYSLLRCSFSTSLWILAHRREKTRSTVVNCNTCSVIGKFLGSYLVLYTWFADRLLSKVVVMTQIMQQTIYLRSYISAKGLSDNQMDALIGRVHLFFRMIWYAWNALGYYVLLSFNYFGGGRALVPSPNLQNHFQNISRWCLKDYRFLLPSGYIIL